MSTFEQIRQHLKDAENGVLSLPANSDDSPRRARVALHNCKIAIWKALDHLNEAMEE